jgi:hypothetical protein
MALQLQDLKTSISQLSNEDLMKRLMDIRANRRLVKPKTEAKTKSSKPAKEVSLDAILASASPDMIEEMIKQLEAKR